MKESFLTKNLSPIITVIVLFCGVVGSWYTFKLSLEQVKKDIEMIQGKNETYDKQFRLVEVQTVQDTQDIKRIKEDISEIKQDVKSLLRKIH